MIIWINGAFGSGKTVTAHELHRRLPDSFVYDPERVGYFIRRNSNGIFSSGDFQDIPLWRQMNYQMLKLINDNFDGIVIVPMTLVNADYFHEIVGRLLSDGVDLRHFILYADREVLTKRIKTRALPIIGRTEFALAAIDRCLEAFDNQITETRIYNNDIGIDDVVESIAEQCGLSLAAGRSSSLGRRVFRIRLTLKGLF